MIADDDLVGDGAQREIAHAVEVHLEILHELPDLRLAGDLKKEAVELVVLFHHLFQLVCAKGNVLHGEILFKAHEVLLRAHLTDLPDHGGLQRCAQEACLLHQVVVDEGDGGLFLRDDLHQLHLFQLRQGLPDRGAGDGEGGGQLVFADLTTGRQLEADDILFEYTQGIVFSRLTRERLGQFHGEPPEFGAPPGRKRAEFDAATP